MSLINVSELITDPDFAQPNGINVIRRQNTIQNHRNTIVETQLKVSGIITIADDTSTNFQEGFNRNDSKIHIFTLKKLYVYNHEEDNTPPGQGYLSDIVLFHGNKYEVVSVLDDTDYGFSRATATVMEQG